MTDNIKLPPMPKAHTVVKPKDSEPFGLITTRDALNFAAEAVRLNATVPDTRKMFSADWCVAARFRNREDVVYDGLVGPGGCPTFENAHNVAMLSVAPQPAPVDQNEARDAARWRYTAQHIGVAWNEKGFTSLVRIVSDKHREMLGDMVDRMMAGDWPEAAPQPAQLLDDESDALTIAYLHGHGKGKDSVQPFLAEKDALLRQALYALELPCDRWNAVQYRIVHDAIKAIRNHLGVEP